MDEDNTKKSDFNEAAYKMQRIHELQQVINKCSIDKTGWFVGEEGLKMGTLKYDDKSKRNYEVIYSCLVQLCMEMRGKLSATEQRDISIKRNVAKEVMRNYPIFTYTLEGDGSGKKETFNNYHWTILDNYLIDFEELVRYLLDVHEYSGVDRGMDQGL